MNVVLFCHAFTSCWNNGNAHFLRGVARELLRRGHHVTVHEPEDGWSRRNAAADGGAVVLAEAEHVVEGVTLHRYREGHPDLDRALDHADIVLVHEWNPPELIAAIGRRRAGGAPFRLYFHDTHHRAVTAADELSRFDLDGYDGVLAFGAALRDIYVRRGWASRAYTWHEAADTALYRPRDATAKDCDLVWIGNWGDGERNRELHEFLIDPVARLKLAARVYGVRYPQAARDALDDAGIAYGGWLPNHHAPAAFARARVTVHVPRGPYAQVLPGIPTIRVFEALACGIPLVSAPWSDVEGLFPPGCYLRAADERRMEAALRAVLSDPDLAADLAAAGLRAIRARHTCRHRVDELLAIVSGTMPRPAERPMAIAAGGAP